MSVLFSIYCMILYRIRWAGHCCLLHRETLIISPQVSELSLAMASSGNTSPPPRYEHPPPYAVAVGMEKETYDQKL